MRLVVDTNILISALLASTSLPAQLIVLWRQGRFDLLTAAEQLDELRRVARYPKIRERLAPALAGRLVNDLRTLAVTMDKLPIVDVSTDTDDDDHVERQRAAEQARALHAQAEDGGLSFQAYRLSGLATLKPISSTRLPSAFRTYDPAKFRQAYSFPQSRPGPLTGRLRSSE